MGMTRKEAANHMAAIKMMFVYQGIISPDVYEAIDLALAALRGPTGEQVGRMRGEWEWYDEEIGNPLDGIEREWGWRCSKCKTVLPDDFDDPDNPPAMRFCQWCGAPMTSKAVGMMVEKLRSLGEEC